jgi:hypothetical protein
MMPIIPAETWKPSPGDEPVFAIALLLSATIGLPYVALSSTGPLLQAWFARTHPQLAGSTYRLYALSNVGSLLALLAYPFGVDPLLPRIEQAWGWSIGFWMFALLCGWCAIGAARMQRGVTATAPVPTVQAHDPAPASPGRRSGPPSTACAGAEHDRQPAITVADRVMWVVLPMCATVLLLAATSQVSEEIAPMPFVWVLPLAVYLITFIIAFEWPRLYDRRVFGALALATPWLYLALLVDDRVGIRTQLALYLFIVLVCCMVCHGEAYRLRPPADRPRQLTAFYLALATGGALGGVFVSLAAPAIFSFNLEIHLAIFGSIALLLVALLRDPASPFFRFANRGGWLGLALAVTLAGYLVSQAVYERQRRTIAQTRSFYGSLSVKLIPAAGEQPPHLRLEHGRINHGAQVLTEQDRRRPTAYYIASSGAGLAMRLLGAVGDQPPPPRRVAVVGLGAGALAGWARSGDVFRFYEINPDVERLARDPFTFLADAVQAGAIVEVVMGDARLSMEREQPQNYDVIVLDAFSGDAVPTHLLTREAFATYMRHLRPGGVIAANISNRYLDLSGVALRQARELGLHAVMVETLEEPIQPSSASLWMLMSSDQAFLEHPEVRGRAKAIAVDAGSAPLWTDDRSSVLGILR